MWCRSLKVPDKYMRSSLRKRVRHVVYVSLRHQPRETGTCPVPDVSHLYRDRKALLSHDVRKGGRSRGGMDAISMLCSGAAIVPRQRVGTILRTPFAAIPPLFPVLIVIAYIGEVVRGTVHELRDSAGNVLVQVRLQLSLEVEALVLAGLVLLVVVDPLELSRGGLIELWCGARRLQ